VLCRDVEVPLHGVAILAAKFVCEPSVAQLLARRRIELQETRARELHMPERGDVRSVQSRRGLHSTM
jgi:hypothetical protein